jgi:alpha-aminoadipate carrier protein LysW
MPHSAECPECAANVSLPDDPVVGEIVQCAECGVELEAVSQDPWKFARAPEEEEDWGE